MKEMWEKVRPRDIFEEQIKTATHAPAEEFQTAC